MRIVLTTIYDVRRGGGLSSHVEQLAAALRVAGHEVECVTPHGGRSRASTILELDVPRALMRPFGRARSFLAYLRLSQRLLRRSLARRLSEGPAVIHAHDPVALLAALEAGGGARLRGGQPAGPDPGTGAGARADPRAAPHAGSEAGPRSGNGTHGELPTGPHVGLHVGTQAGPYAVPSGRPRSLPLFVLTVHGDLANMAASDGSIPALSRARSECEAIEALAYREADELIAVDRRLHDHCAGLAGGRSVHIVQNFVDTTSFRPPTAAELCDLPVLRKKVGIPLDRPVVFCPRRLVRKNGVLHAFRAIGSMAPGDRPFLLQAGTGIPDEKRRVERAIAECRMEADSRLLGDVDRATMTALYRIARIVLVPSVPDEGVIEATSIAALEAMASEAAVIASRIGGLTEIIENGTTGILVEPGDEGAIAEAVRRLMSDPALVERLGQRARQAVLERHATHLMSRRFEAIYEEGRSRLSRVPVIPPTP